MVETRLQPPGMQSWDSHGIALVTGTRGIGIEVASALHRMGMATYVVGRSRSAGDAAIQRLACERADVPCGFEQADLGDLDSVRDLAERLGSYLPRLNVLVNNAGIVTAKRSLTSHGWERHIGVNYLGHFALTGLLLPMLREADAPRVVSVVSRGVSGARLRLEDLQSAKTYNPMAAYSSSKLALLSFGIHLEAVSRQEGWGLSSYVAHPGISPTEIMDGAVESPTGRRAMRLLHGLIGHAPTEAAKSIIRCAVEADLPAGTVLGPSGAFEIRGEPGFSSIAACVPPNHQSMRLWQLSQELTGSPFPFTPLGS